MTQEQPIEKGLNRENRTSLVVLVTLALLIWGPIEPYGIIVRFAYLILIPIFLWFALKQWGHNLHMDSASNNRFNRALAGAIAGALMFSAIISLTEKYHFECDQYIQTRDGGECVGDYVKTKGPDIYAGIMEIIFAGIAFSFAYSERNKEDS